MIDHAVNLGLGADVDAARGFIQEKQIDMVMEKPGEGNFLLVAAGKVADFLRWSPASDAQAIDPGLSGSAFVGRKHERWEIGESEVVGDGQVEGQAFGFAVFADHASALVPAGAGSGRTLVKGKSDPAGFDRIETENGAQKLGAARADESGDAQDFPAMELEGGGFWFLGAAEILDVEDDFAGGARGSGIEVFDFSADHEGDDLIGAGV